MRDGQEVREQPLSEARREHCPDQIQISKLQRYHETE